MIIHGQDTLEFADQVRKFVATMADNGLMANAICDTFFRIPMEQFPTQTFLEIFEADAGTASCGLTASMMVKILLDNGIDAYTYNFGIKDSRLTHVIVLVKHDKKLFIFDPYLNYALLDKTGSYTDLLTVIRHSRNEDSGLHPSTDTVWADMLLDEGLLKGLPFSDSLMQTNICSTFYNSGHSVQDSIRKYLTARCFECNKDECYSFVKRFETAIGKDLFQGLKLKLNHLQGAHDAAQIDARIDSVLSAETQQKQEN